MLAFIGRRIGTLVVILFGSSFILYNLTAISGDPLEQLKFATDERSKATLRALTRQLDLETPPPLRYFKWLKGILGLFVGNPNFGLTRDGEPVLDRLAAAIPVTLRLVTAATLTAIILGITLGIITALRQYSRFDYVVTFFSFLMFSLPIFWVAVLLKEFLAIRFNDFLQNATIPIGWLILLSVLSAIFWTGILGGQRAALIRNFAIVFTVTGSILTFISATKWLLDPGLGPIVLFLFAIGIAYGMTAVSIGIENKSALKASVSMAILTLILYYPLQYIFDRYSSWLLLLLLLVLTVGTAALFGKVFAKIDQGPVIRTTILTGIGCGLLIILDRLMQTWSGYIADDAVNGRPIPTIGQLDPLLTSTDFWVITLDRAVHLILPTVALTLISFAGYIRFSRGTLLEVLNQDYIRTARAKGLNERTVIMRHAFRNTMIPLTTIVVVDLAGIIGGAIITERVFGWSGMGTLFNKAIGTYDLNLLMGVFFITASLSVLANLVADLLYAVLDPRIRVGARK
ncbi:MAG: ABC transporter permease [Candidatus Nanopelagicaceae bacterium]